MKVLRRVIFISYREWLLRDSDSYLRYHNLVSALDTTARRHRQRRHKLAFLAYCISGPKYAQHNNRIPFPHLAWSEFCWQNIVTFTCPEFWQFPCVCPCGEAVCLSCPDWLKPLMCPRSEPSAECSARMCLTLTYLPCLFIRGKKQTRQVFNTKFPWAHHYFYPNDKAYKAKNFAIYLLLGKRQARRENLKFLNVAASIKHHRIKSLFSNLRLWSAFASGQGSIVFLRIIRRSILQSD